MRESLSVKRMRPLLRINDWMTLEIGQKLQEQQQTVRDLDARLALAERELGASYRQMDVTLASAQVDKSGYELASSQTAAWLRGVLHLRARRDTEAGKVRELQAQIGELKRKRTVIERRREEAAREYENVLNARVAAEQDDLWLNRRLA